MNKPLPFTSWPTCAFAALAFSLVVAWGAEPKVSFNRDVRPILSDKCFQCHGPDEGKRKSGLRLDVRESALKGGKNDGAALVPGKPEASAVLARVRATNEDDVMPPAKVHKPVTPAEVDVLRRWIAQGAEYQGHWAFLKPERPAVPTVATGFKLFGAKPKLQNPIDAFIQERLAKEKLSPAPEAPRATLIRRVALDLTGIPPTPEEVDAFVADQSPAAYERVVDRLLASPRYGEKMAQQWLDFARYADSNGFQSDTTRQMWGWRDWVIQAFNTNLPFDRFTINQIAGDLLPDGTMEDKVATGFHRNNRLNGEGGRIVEEWFAETVMDRVETTGLTWMGLTLNCCRCHDHKFDPITQREFYQLFAYFNSNEESGVMDDFGGGGSTRAGGNSRPILRIPTPEQKIRLAEFETAQKKAEADLAAAEKQLPALQAEWEKHFLAQMKKQTNIWTTLEPAEVKSEGGATFQKQTDGTWLASGKNADFDTYTVVAPLAEGSFSGVLLEALPDATLPSQSLGRYSNGNFVFTDINAEITAAGLEKPLRATFTRAEADYEQKGWEVSFIVKDKPKRGTGAKNKKGWAVDGPTKKEPRQALFVCSPITVPSNATLRVTLHHDALAGHNIGRFKLSTTTLPPAAVSLKGGQISGGILAALKLEPAERSAAQKKEVAKFFRENTDNPAKQAELAIATAKKAADDLTGQVPSVMVMNERAQPRDAFMLKRGEYDKPGDKVERALPAVLSPLPAGAPNNRLGLAQWLVSGEHPLTARVWVNRAWEKFFGTGIVKTTENLGSQSEWPSHPELLDWLATEFVRLKWDMKAMQKLMVMSTTYRQSARVTPQLLERDPENRLLARGPRFRLPAETVRDQALAISGLLVEKVGGPSVRPYMPAGVWDETSVYGDMRGYKADTGDALYRRTLYTIWKRTAAPPTMLLFDSPSREICTVKRSRSNTPLQALALLNEVTYVEAARRLGERMLTEGGTTPEQRVAWAFRRATGRMPEPKELAVLVKGLTKRLARFQQDAEDAKRLIAQGASKPAAGLNAPELAAYTTTANILLNLDEVVTRE